MSLTLYSASWCAPCKALKMYAESVGIKFDLILIC